VPFVSKIIGIPIARIATQLMLGKSIKDFPELKHKPHDFVGVKEAVFPFNMFPEVDPLLGPEMRATGEVMGIDKSFGLAFYKAQEAVGTALPGEGTVLITVADRNKEEACLIAKKLASMGFKICTTENTHNFFLEKGIKSERALKLNEGRPNIIDDIKNKKIQLIINTPSGRHGKTDDSYIRMTAIQCKIPYITTMAAAKASVDGIEALKKGKSQAPVALQEYHR
jgi:carbamoyl-phosphate synthase large subunit